MKESQRVNLTLLNRVKVPIGQSLNQQPVPSVARLAESVSANSGYLVNKSREAYTGNTTGRRGDVLPLSNSASLRVKNAVGDVFNVTEACTNESHW